MRNNRKKPITGYVVLLIASMFFAPYFSSCGKSGNASGVGLNTQLLVLNLSPNIQPVNLYMNFLLQSNSSYAYPYPSGYFYLNSIDTPLQLRTTATTTIAALNLVTLDTNFQSNHKYTLFITGSYNVTPSLNTIKTILTQDDTTAIPPIGYGKIRFVNASIQNGTGGLDVTANSTVAFSNIKVAQISPYIKLPAGNYTFKINQTGTPDNSLTTTLGITTIQDGRLYTLYSYGVPLRTDSAAFGAGVITNR